MGPTQTHPCVSYNADGEPHIRAHVSYICCAACVAQGGRHRHARGVRG